MKMSNGTDAAILSFKNFILCLEFKENKFENCRFLFHKQKTLMPFDFKDNSGNYLVKSDMSLFFVKENKTVQMQLNSKQWIETDVGKAGFMFISK